MKFVSVLGHLARGVVDPESRRLSTLVIHLIQLWVDQLVIVAWEGVHLKFVPFLSGKLENPASIKLGNQVSALWVVDAVLLPACENFRLQLCGLLTGFDTALSFEVATDQLA